MCGVAENEQICVLVNLTLGLDHSGRLVPIICRQAELPIPAGQKILFGPVDKPVRRESTNLAVALKPMTNTEA